jgi:hypothetical protein
VAAREKQRLKWSPWPILDAVQGLLGRLPAAVAARFCAKRLPHQLPSATLRYAEVFANVSVGHSLPPHAQSKPGAFRRHKTSAALAVQISWDWGTRSLQPNRWPLTVMTSWFVDLVCSKLRAALSEQSSAVLQARAEFRVDALQIRAWNIFAVRRHLNLKISARRTKTLGATFRCHRSVTELKWANGLSLLRVRIGSNLVAASLGGKLPPPLRLPYPGTRRSPSSDRVAA